MWLEWELMLRTVKTTRYVVPLREGGSLPAILEADDQGMYVVKFSGAGQGPLALIAELVAGEIARALGLRVPEIVFAEVDPALGRNDPDYEIRQLLKASHGRNLGLDYLPGSTTYDPAAKDEVGAEEASLVVWLDAFVMNVDRTARNANLLMWHRKLYLIDHGAALYAHHDWAGMAGKAEARFEAVKEHVLLGKATRIAEAGAVARERLGRAVFEAIVAEVPEEWLERIASGESAAEKRAAYVDFLTRRLTGSRGFEEEARDAAERLI